MDGKGTSAPSNTCRLWLCFHSYFAAGRSRIGRVVSQTSLKGRKLLSLDKSSSGTSKNLAGSKFVHQPAPGKASICCHRKAHGRGLLKYPLGQRLAKTCTEVAYIPGASTDCRVNFLLSLTQWLFNSCVDLALVRNSFMSFGQSQLNQLQHSTPEVAALLQWQVLRLSKLLFRASLEALNKQYLLIGPTDTVSLLSDHLF